MLAHFLWSWHWFKNRAINRNFHEAICIDDEQGNLHIVESRRDLWAIAWKTYRSGGTTE